MSEALVQFVTTFLEEKNIACTIFPPPFISLAEHDMGLRRSIMKNLPDTSLLAHSESGLIEEGTIYHMVDYYCCHYSLMYLPDGKYLLVGPWLPRKIEGAAFYNQMEQLALPQTFWRQMRDYYFLVPVLENSHSIEALINHLGKIIHKNETLPIHFMDTHKMKEWEEYFADSPLQASKDTPLSMQVLEERYEKENKFLDAVSCGNTARALNLVGDRLISAIPQRLPDKLSDIKAYLIVGNTLMRKSVEKAGVHPWYIDRFSSKNVLKIEQCSTMASSLALFHQMVKKYCQMVTEHSLPEYSPLVQKTITTIDADLKADLTLNAFATQLNVTGSYLSSLFKREVGRSLTNYVNKRRIDQAKTALATTAIPISDIAAEVGIPDVHYFNRLFKREFSMTPNAYRKHSVV